MFLYIETRGTIFKVLLYQERNALYSYFLPDEFGSTRKREFQRYFFRNILISYDYYIYILYIYRIW